uniref:Uncharacterized protein n=1 Tax=Arundo donax TaxID=35708 RepID=A0A0A9HNX2_ARUDO
MHATITTSAGTEPSCATTSTCGASEPRSSTTPPCGGGELRTSTTPRRGSSDPRSSSSSSTSTSPSRPGRPRSAERLRCCGRTTSTSSDACNSAGSRGTTAPTTTGNLRADGRRLEDLLVRHEVREVGGLRVEVEPLHSQRSATTWTATTGKGGV